MHERDKKKWFAVHFGNSYFKTAPLASPMITIGLLSPILILAIVWLCSLDLGTDLVLAITPIVMLSDRIADLTRQTDNKMAEYEAIKEKASQEDRLLTEEERSQCINLQKEVMELTKERNLVQDEIDMRETVNSSTKPPTRPKVESEDELQRRYPGLPKRELRYDSIGELVKDVIQADPNMGNRYSTKLRAATGMGESVPSDGGFLVQPDISSRIIEPLFDPASGDAVLSRINTTPVTGNGLSFLAIDETTRETSSWGGIIMYWLGEGSEKTPTSPKMRKVELKLKKIAGLCYLTDELMDDGPAFSARLERGFRTALRSAIIRAIVRGTGAGQPLGLLNSTAKITVSKETGQLANTIVTDNILNMFTQLDPGATNPVWLYNRTCFKQLFQLQVALGAAGALVNLPDGGIASAPNNLLLGIPMVPVSWCPVLGTEGDLILTDLGQYEFITKGGPKINYSIHVRFIYDETAMRIVYRCDGQPAVISSTTLEDGSTSVSPIVTLETRS